MVLRASGAALVLTLALLATPGIVGQESPADVSAQISLVRSADAPGRIDQARLTRVFWHLIREQKLQALKPPKVLVLHVSNEVAALAGISASVVRTDQRKDRSGEGYYQLWLVGEPATADYVVGLQTVLEDEFGLYQNAGARSDILTRVARQDMATVDAKSLATR